MIITARNISVSRILSTGVGCVYTMHTPWACMPPTGMHTPWAHAPSTHAPRACTLSQAHTPHGYYEMRSMSGWYASYWNAFLFLGAAIIVRKN